MAAPRDVFPAAATPFHTSRLQKGEELVARYPSLRVQPLTSHLLSLHTRLRDQRTDTVSFVRAADALLRPLVEFALTTLPTRTIEVTTPTQATFVGCEFERELCGVSIVRAGESMEHALRHVLEGVRIGKILIQRDESCAEKTAHFFYSKLPPNVNQLHVLLLDPMLASGGSAICAIKHLLSRGILLEHITMVCLIVSPEGVSALLEAFPSLTLVAGMLDDHIDQRKFIVPGVGDFGDRYFGTVEVVAEKSEEFSTINATLQEQK